MRVTAAVITLLGAVQATPCWSQDISEQRRIVVDGYGEVKTMPDLATLSYTLRGEGTTSDEAVKAMVAMGKTIHAMLYTIDKAVEPKTADVKVVPVKDSECKDRQYEADNQLSKGVCAIDRFSSWCVGSSSGALFSLSRIVTGCVGAEMLASSAVIILRGTMALRVSALTAIPRSASRSRSAPCEDTI